MKKFIFKIAVPLSFYSIFIWLSIRFLMNENNSTSSKIGMCLIGYPIFILIILSLFLRNKLKFKNLYIKNPLNNKDRFEIESGISTDILYEKTKELIQNSNYQLTDENKIQLELLAQTYINFRSYGENIYIQIKEGKTTNKIVFTYVNINRLNDYGRNKDLFKQFVTEYEESLTI